MESIQKELTVEVFSEDSDRFWLLMGRFFAYRDFAFEMGGWQFYTKKGSFWYVLFDGETLVGFCSAIKENTHFYFDNFFILKEHRLKGYSKILNAHRLEHIKGVAKEVRVISDKESQIRVYISQGFVKTGNRGRYSKFKIEF